MVAVAAAATAAVAVAATAARAVATTTRTAWRAPLLAPPAARVLPPALFEDPIAQCRELYYTQTLDHYNWRLPSASAPVGTNGTYQQRYFVCDTHWSRDDTAPVFFYTGNEANVELYLNATGLMWQNAEKYGALLVFAEHRYFGKSVPAHVDVDAPLSSLREQMVYCTVDQALADFAELVRFLKADLHISRSAAWVAFGGSYGGMLASWLRITRPATIDGAIAASAPIWSFAGMTPPYDEYSFAHIQTTAATPACADNVRRFWRIVERLGATDAGKQLLQTRLSLCKPVKQYQDVYNWVSSALGFLTMGNYPYATSYITNGGCVMPPWPMTLACKPLNSTTLTDDQVLEGVAAMVGVYNNCTKTKKCFDVYGTVNKETAQDGLFWSYLYCTSMVQPFATNGKSDMFWNAPFVMADAIRGCQQQWGVTPRPYYAIDAYGGKQLAAASNIVFSNGMLDPWRGGGIVDDINESVKAVVMRRCAHHVDLFFSNPDDPVDVVEARKFELANIDKWMSQAAARQ